MATSWRSAFCTSTGTAAASSWRCRRRGARASRTAAGRPACRSRAAGRSRKRVRARRAAWRRTAPSPSADRALCCGATLHRVPAAAERCRVEPARVVPAGDVRRIEEPLPGEVADPRPVGGGDAHAEAAEEAGRVHDRRLHQPWAGVQRGMAEDRADDGLDLVAVLVDRLERRLRPVVGLRRHEVAPQLLHEERWVHVVRDAEVAGVAPVEVPGLPEHALHAGVVAGRVEVEVVCACTAPPAVLPAGQRARLLAHVALGVGAAVGAEREQLHHLAAVVLVRRAFLVLQAVQPFEHRGVRRDVAQQVVERAERVLAEQLVLLEHQLLAADAVVGRREPVVPDERHPLDERAARAHHAVEPPGVIVAPRRVRRQRMALVVVRLRADEPLEARVDEGVHGAGEPELRERLGLALARAEAGAPEQTLGLGLSERTTIDRGRRHLR